LTAETSLPSGRPGNLSAQPRGSRFKRLAVKELRETLRDRRTIVTLLLMPVLVYPILGIGLQQFALSGGGAQRDEVTWRIAAEDAEDMSQFKRMLDLGERFLRAGRDTPLLPSQDLDAPLSVNSLSAGMADRSTAEPQADQAGLRRIEIFEASDIDEQLKTLEIDLGIRRRPSTGSQNPVAAHDFELHYRANMPLSREVAEYVEVRLRAFNELQLRTRLRRVGEVPNNAISWVWHPVVQESQTPFPLASLAPMVLILMTITGAVYPAIDLTAGERERGTLESLMAAPVSRLSLLGAKYVAVLTVALLTAIANLVAMSITLRGTGLGDALLGPGGMSIGVLLIMFLLLALFAAFFSAVLLAITSFARSFKEAQAYLIPLMLLSLGPGFVSVIPGMKLEGLLSVAPLVNIVLLARDVIQGTAQPLPAAVAVISTALYAVGALALATRIFGSDSVLYGSQGSWADILRKPEHSQDSATVSAAWFTAAIIYPLYFAATGLLTALKDDSVSRQIWFAAAGTIVVFGLVPWLISTRQRIRLVPGFQLRRPAIFALLGAILLGVSLWPLAHELFVLTERVGFGSISPDALRRLAPQVEVRLSAWRQLSPLLILGAFAFAPALFEEFFFRGYLLGALRNRWPAWAAISATALLFGVFHLSVGGLAAVERVVTSTFLGLVLGWLCWRTRSIWPGVVTHSLHNGILLSLAYWKDKLPGGAMASESGQLPAMLTLSAAALSLVGVACVYFGSTTASFRNVASSTITPNRTN
jgi:sodium transport system permease protein